MTMQVGEVARIQVIWLGFGCVMGLGQPLGDASNITFNGGVGSSKRIREEDNDRMRMWTLMNAFGKKGDKGTLLYQRKMRNVRKHMKINNRGGQIP